MDGTTACDLPYAGRRATPAGCAMTERRSDWERAPPSTAELEVCMDGQRLMARLSARSARWDGMRGGRSEFTPSDIAAALGMIPDGFPRELLCYLWWPDALKCSASEIERMILHRVMRECRARAIDAITSRLSYGVIELERIRTRTLSKTLSSSLEHHRSLMESASERRWPEPRDTYLQLAHGVLIEAQASKVCPSCRGVGRLADAPRRENACQRCGGWGTLGSSDLARARALRMTWHAFRKTWKAPYEWAVEDCKSAAADAEHALLHALGVPVRSGGEEHKSDSESPPRSPSFEREKRTWGLHERIA
jgi:hypothetical protein